MSGTRSPFPKAQATDVLIVAHGQPGNPAPPERALQRLAARVNAHLPGRTIRAATLAAPGALEAALRRASGATLVYPFFMTPGWFTTTELPRRLGGRPLRVLDPFGADPALPATAAATLSRALRDLGWSEAETDVLIAAHGSARGNRPARASIGFVRQLARFLPAVRFRMGFIEQSPRLLSSATRCPRQSLCLPFFAMEGAHVRDDLSEALGAARFQGPVMAALGQQRNVPDLIAASLRAALAQRETVA